MDFYAKAIFLIVVHFSKSIHGQSICADQPYFYYECSQLARYCRVNRAVGIRSSCPLTCGLCQKDQPNAKVGSEKESGSGIIRFFPQSGDGENRREAIAETTTTTFLPPQVNTLRSIVLVQTTPTTRSSIVESPSIVQTPAPTTKFRVGDAEASERLKQCCSAGLIGSNCASLCSYDIKKEDALLKAASGLCTLDDARIWVRCAAGGRLNAECCRNRGVTGCDDACNGQLGFDIAQLLGCLNLFFEPIVSCHRENLIK